MRPYNGTSNAGFALKVDCVRRGGNRFVLVRNEGCG